MLKEAGEEPAARTWRLKKKGGGGKIFTKELKKLREGQYVKRNSLGGKLLMSEKR